MSTPPVHHDVQCSVTGGDKLPHSLGGEEAVCRLIRPIVAPAVAEAGQGARVVVAIVAPSAATADVTMADGSSRPPSRIDVSDRALTAQSIEMLARAVANSIRNGSKASK